jgi:hypothetical protein
MMRVRFPLPAPLMFADIAQAVERILGKDEVPSSILGISTIIHKGRPKVCLFVYLDTKPTGLKKRQSHGKGNV